MHHDQWWEQGLGYKYKDLTFKAKAKDLTFKTIAKTKDLSFEAKAKKDNLQGQGLTLCEG